MGSRIKECRIVEDDDRNSGQYKGWEWMQQEGRNCNGERFGDLSK